MAAAQQSYLPLSENAREAIQTYSPRYTYSEKYCDDVAEYRHVTLPKEMLKFLPGLKAGLLLSETEWRAYGIQQSLGWEHYMIHTPEPHILLFKRSKGFDQAAALAALCSGKRS